MVRILGCRVSPGALIGLDIDTDDLAAAIHASVLVPDGQAGLVGRGWAPAGVHSWFWLIALSRDTLSRLIFGASTTFSIALLTTTCSFGIRIVTGFTEVMVGGSIPMLLCRFVNAIMASSTLIFALVILSVFGASGPVLIGIIAALASAHVFRLCRAAGLKLAVVDCVEVAGLNGEKLWWVMRSEVLPNALSPLMTEFSLRFCLALFFIAALSFLGPGIQSPVAVWGSMVGDNAQAINFGGIAQLIPTAAIAQLTIGFNLLVGRFPSIYSRAHGEGA